MAPAGAFGVIRVDRAAGDGRERRLEVAGFIQRIGVNRDLHVHLVGNSKTVVDRRRSRTPILVELEAQGAGANLFPGRLGHAHVALAQESQIHGKRFGGFEHAANVPRSRRAGGRARAGGRSRAAADHRRHPGRQCFIDLLRTYEMDMGIDAAGGQDQSLTRDDLGRRADGNADLGLDIGISGLADSPDGSVLQADIGFANAPVVDDEGIGDHGICNGVARTLPLPHSIADDFAAAEFHFLSIHREILFHLDE